METSEKKEKLLKTDQSGTVKLKKKKWKKLNGYVGFANLPNQIYRKAVKKNFEFTLMVVGKLNNYYRQIHIFCINLLVFLHYYYFF